MIVLFRKEKGWLGGGGDGKHRLRSMILGLSSESPRELVKIQTPGEALEFVIQ